MNKSKTVSKLTRLSIVMILLNFYACGSRQASNLTVHTAMSSTFDDFVQRIVNEYKIPGIAIGIVKGGKVVLAKGYGFRNLENQKPVTPETVFAIGSNSKAFTATDIAMLVDQHKLDLDVPVRTYLNNFKLKDQYSTDHVTLRDMLSHRTGLPRHEVSWYCSPASREQLISRLQYQQPSKELRETCQYNNLMFVTAGYIAGQVGGGLSWEELTKRSIIQPLGMDATDFFVSEMVHLENYATPYSVSKQGNPVRVSPRNIDAVGPAGSINSNVIDMTKWLSFQLSKGKNASGQQLVSSDALEVTRTPQVVAPVPPPFPELSTPTYALGWGSFYYRGHRLIWHNGGIDGYLSYVGFLPDDQIGIVVLTNSERGAYQMIPLQAFDELLGLSAIDWIQRFKNSGGDSSGSDVPSQPETIAVERPFGEYVGRYSNPGYDSVVVAQQSDGLHFKINCFDLPMTKLRADAFSATFPESFSGQRISVVFGQDESGNINSFAASLEPTVTPIQFRRR